MGVKVKIVRKIEPQKSGALGIRLVKSVASFFYRKDWS